MAFAEDLGAYLADFGQVCSSGGGSFLGLLDQPDELLDLTRANVHSRQYELTYITTAVALARDAAVSVGGISYVVREAPRQVGDGAFSRVLLSKV
jgi:hypothetical protein